MVTDAGKVAPYAPTANVVGVIRRLRERGLPNPLGLQELVRMSVPEGNVSRVLVALRFLELIDGEGRHTEAFARVGKASDDEYPKLLADAIRTGYHQVFDVGLNPATASESELEDAFRGYEPRAQRGRMITLFKGLCQEAGLAPGGPPETRSRKPQIARPKTTNSGSKDSATPSHEPGAAMPKTEDELACGAPLSQESSPDYDLLQALIRRLPRNGKWTEDQRDRWLQAVTANIDVLIEVVEAKVELAG